MKTSFTMNKITVSVVTLIVLIVSQALYSQTTAPPALPDTSKMTYNQISQSMNLFVYPSGGQNKQVQKEDEFECYKWAVEQSGIDPLNLPKVEAAPVQSGPTGAGVKGAAKGAAAGAAIGAITGDAGEGAAVGAIVGGLAGRRQGQQAQTQQNQQSQANAAATEQAMIDRFTKAFAVCIEGKGYTIK